MVYIKNHIHAGVGRDYTRQTAGFRIVLLIRRYASPKASYIRTQSLARRKFRVFGVFPERQGGYWIVYFIKVHISIRKTAAALKAMAVLSQNKIQSLM